MLFKKNPCKLFLADILTCHIKKGTGVTNNVMASFYSSVPLSCQHAQKQNLETKVAKWNSSIIFIICTCAFYYCDSQNVNKKNKPNTVTRESLLKSPVLNWDKWATEFAVHLTKQECQYYCILSLGFCLV